MKSLHIISFDYHKKDEPKMPYSIAKIISYLKADRTFNKEYKLKQTSFNMSKEAKIFNRNLLKNDFIALAVYSWSVSHVKSFLNFLTINNYDGKIILGAYEITDYSAQLEYPETDFFIIGHAEEALLNILLNERHDKFINKPPSSHKICNVYSTNIISDIEGCKVRLETKRNCPFRCTFCAHKDLNNPKIEEIDLNQTIEELKYLNKSNIKKVNIIDPIFNIGNNYLKILEHLLIMNFQPKISLQVRFEYIENEKGKQFLELVKQLNCELEFGLQTIIPAESEVIKRKNDSKKIQHALQQLNDLDINYEVSLIYGLPLQTLQSFEQSIYFLKENSCKKIIAYPLMLLKGTSLFQNQNIYNFKEEYINGIPYVCSSNSFNKKDYNQMKKLASEL